GLSRVTFSTSTEEGEEGVTAFPLSIFFGRLSDSGTRTNPASSWALLREHKDFCCCAAVGITTFDFFAAVVSTAAPLAPNPESSSGCFAEEGLTDLAPPLAFLVSKRAKALTEKTKGKTIKRAMPPRREPDHPAPTQATVVAQFRDYHAEKFSRQGDPRIVDEWIQGLEFIFEVMDCPNRYRVVCAQLQLTGDARLWWNAYWSMRPGVKAGCTWDMLKELVREKYYPTYYRAEMERQFLSLQQGTRTVDEYEREFTRLAAFVPDLVRTEAQREQRFIDGLYPAVRHNIVGHGTQTYARAVSIAQEVDASIRREAVRDRAQPSAQVQPFTAPPAAQPAKEKKRKGKGAQTDRRTRQRQQQALGL
ncbi:Unknown protein, partial [Striga hermonthica]